MSYIPSSKQEFLKHQQAEDEKYIMDALDEERNLLLEPEIDDELIVETTPQHIDTNGSKHLNVSVDRCSTVIYFASICCFCAHVFSRVLF